MNTHLFVSPAALILALSLVSAGTAAARPSLFDVSDPTPERVTRAQLLEELETLQNSRPHPWVGAGLMIGGAVGIGAGLLLYVGGNLIINNLGTIATDLCGVIFGALGAGLMVVAGVVLGIAGGVVLIVGIVKALHTVAVKADHDVKIESAVRRLEAFDRAERPMSMPAAPKLGATFQLVSF
jgi:hypothetical protein